MLINVNGENVPFIFYGTSSAVTHRNSQHIGCILSSMKMPSIYGFYKMVYNKKTPKFGTQQDRFWGAIPGAPKSDN